MNRRKIYAAAIIVATLLTCIGTSHASGRFTLRSLRGVYGFSGSGTLTSPLFGGTVQAAVVGLNSFDGAGGCGIKALLNVGGSVISLTATECSYTVNRDGTGATTITFNQPEFAGTFISNFVIVDNAKELQFVLSADPLSPTTPVTVASGVAKRQTSSDRD